MKKIILLYTLLVLSFIAIGQDVIIKKNGDEIKSNVIEIGSNTIKYKLFEANDSSNYTISKSEVVLIRYKNGRNEVISTSNTNSNQTSQTTTSPNSNPVPSEQKKEESKGKIYFVDGEYGQNGTIISKLKLYQLLIETEDAEIIRLLTKSKNKRNTGKVIAVAAGLPLIAVGSITTLSGMLAYAINHNNPDARGVMFGGGIMVFAGIVLEFTNIGFQRKSQQFMERALTLYNSKYAVKQ